LTRPFSFGGEIFPAIKAQIPYATLKIVGNSPNEAVLKLASEDVKVLGFVPDIRTCYECSDISVAPLTWGGGLKVKIAEAMSYGLPVVATSVGIDGLGLRPGEDVVLGNTPTEFVEGVTKLHQDPICYEKIRTTVGNLSRQAIPFRPSNAELMRCLTSWSSAQ